METVKVVFLVALWVLFLLVIVLILKEKYDTKKSKWIAEGRKVGLERAKWNVERIFPKLAPLNLRKPRENYYKCDFLNAWIVENNTLSGITHIITTKANNLEEVDSMTMDWIAERIVNGLEQ